MLIICAADVNVFFSAFCDRRGPVIWQTLRNKEFASSIINLIKTAYEIYEALKCLSRWRHEQNTNVLMILIFLKWSNSAEVLKLLVAHHQVGFMKYGQSEVKSSIRRDGVQLAMFVTL